MLHSNTVSVQRLSQTLQPHAVQHNWLPCPSLSPGVCSNSCPLESVMPSNHLIFCHPLLLPSVFPSIRVFSNELALCIRWSKHGSFSISPSNEYSGLISFRIDWLALFAVQRDSQESSPALHLESINFQHSAFFMVQLSHPYMNDYWKNHSFD